MNFLRAQERAEQARKRMLVLIALAVLLIPAAAIGTGWMLSARAISLGTPSPIFPLIAAPLLLASLVIGVLVLTSWFRLRAVEAQGGAGLALAMGARVIATDTKVSSERRLLNVVEEMSIAASAVPPRVYLLDRVNAPNALCVGARIRDGVLVVSRGLLDTLTRDELQAVVAHELAHLQNGDAALNTWLLGVFEGVSAMSAPARHLSKQLIERRFGENDDDSMVISGVVACSLFVGLASPVLGAMLLAALFSWMLVHVARARIVREMEFLADADAVQFTRYPQALGMALSKMNLGPPEPLNPLLARAGHMLFSRPYPDSRWGRLTATHPAVEERIRRVAPDVLEGRRRAPQPPNVDKAMARAPVQPVPAPAKVWTVRGQALGVLPDAVRQGLSQFDDARSTLLALVHAQLPGALPPAPGALSPAVRWCMEAGEAWCLPLMDLVLPVVREGSVAQRKEVLLAVDRMMQSSESPGLSAYALRRIVREALREQPVAAAGSAGIEPKRIKQDLSLVLTLAVHLQATTSAGAVAAFEAAVQLAPGKAPWSMATSKVTSDQVDSALRHLSACSAVYRKKVIEALTRALTHDGELTAREQLWLRAVAQALHC